MTRGSLNNRLGRNDQRKLDEYLTAVRAVEQQVQRSQAWIDVPKPAVDGSKINFEVNPRSYDELLGYFQTMMDLIFLAFQTDTTRVATFQLHPETSGARFGPFLGFPDSYHALSHHGGDPENLAKIAKIDRFHIEQLAYLMKKLKAAQDADGRPMLDRTLLVFGGGMSNGETGGHYATNVPVLLAGGRGLGIRQGQHIAFQQPKHDIYKARPQNPPLSNLFLTMLKHLDVPVDSFANSTGTLGAFSA